MFNVHSCFGTDSSGDCLCSGGNDGVALQAESAVQETEETDIADIEADNQIAAIDDSEVPGSDDIESAETESMETETETETETEIEMHTITGVQDLARRIAE